MGKTGRKNKPGAGRPHKKVDQILIFNLAKIHCTREEIASITGVHIDTLRDNFSNVIEKGMEEGRASLRRKQFELALKGDRTMLVWLGKQFLGQRDRVDLDAQVNGSLDVSGYTEVQLRRMAAGRKPDDTGE